MVSDSGADSVGGVGSGTDSETLAGAGAEVVPGEGPVVRTGAVPVPVAGAGAVPDTDSSSDAGASLWRR